MDRRTFNKLMTTGVTGLGAAPRNLGRAQQSVVAAVAAAARRRVVQSRPPNGLARFTGVCWWIRTCRIGTPCC